MASTMTTEVWGATLGYEQLSGTGVLTPTIPAGTDLIVIGPADTNNLRWRDDGTNPTASIGMLHRTTDAPLVYRSANLGRLRFIPVTGTGVANLSYYGTEPAAT